MLKVAFCFNENATHIHYGPVQNVMKAEGNGFRNITKLMLRAKNTCLCMLHPELVLLRFVFLVVAILNNTVFFHFILFYFRTFFALHQLFSQTKDYVSAKNHIQTENFQPFPDCSQTIKFRRKINGLKYFPSIYTYTIVQNENGIFFSL